MSSELSAACHQRRVGTSNAKQQRTRTSAPKMIHVHTPLLRRIKSSEDTVDPGLTTAANVNLAGYNACGPRRTQAEHRDSQCTSLNVERLLLVLKSRGIRPRTFLQAQAQTMAYSGPRSSLIFSSSKETWRSYTSSIQFPSGRISPISSRLASCGSNAHLAPSSPYPMVPFIPHHNQNPDT